jgi:hypothetical protein
MFDKIKGFFREKTTVFCFLALAVLTSCAPATVNRTEMVIDTAALTVLTSQKIVLKRPCTETVTAFCADRDLIENLRRVRLVLVASLRTYWSAVDAYKKATTDSVDTADFALEKSAAYAALKTAVDEAVGLLNRADVQEILSFSSITEN